MTVQELINKLEAVPYERRDDVEVEMIVITQRDKDGDWTRSHPCKTVHYLGRAIMGAERVQLDEREW